MTKFQSHTSDLPEKIKITSKSLIFLSLTKAVVLMGAVISILALLFVPKLQVHSAKLTDKERIELENANRTTLVQALGGLFFFSTAYFTWRNLQIAEENLKVTEKNFNQNIKVAEDKQITESFAKAVEFWFFGLFYGVLALKCQFNKLRNLKLLKLRKPYPSLFINLSLLLIPSTIPLVVLPSK